MWCAGNFIRLNPNYELPKASAQTEQQQYDPNTGMGVVVFRGSNHQLLIAPHPDQYGMMNPNSADASDGVPVLDVRTKNQVEEIPLKDEDLILASPILYGFSLSDKIWRASVIFPAPLFSLTHLILTSGVQRRPHRTDPMERRSV